MQLMIHLLLLELASTPVTLKMRRAFSESIQRVLIRCCDVKRVLLETLVLCCADIGPPEEQYLFYV